MVARFVLAAVFFVLSQPVVAGADEEAVPDLSTVRLMADTSRIYTWGVWESPFPNGVHVSYCGETCSGNVMAAQVGPFKGYCWLWVSDAWFRAPEAVRWYYIHHEVGHCLGIPGHGAFFGSRFDCLMNQSPGIGTPNEWDLLMLRYYSPAFRRTVVPALSGD